MPPPPYSWEDVHGDLENGEDHVAGSYGADNAPYLGIAASKAGVNLKEVLRRQQKLTSEVLNDSLKRHLENPVTQQHWSQIFTFDPLGLTATNPTIAATTAHMTIPELQSQLTRDGKIVNQDGQINVIKAAVDYVWNLPELSSRLELPESKLRDALFEYTKNDDLKDTSKRAYLPPVGGVTVYMFGDIEKVADPTCEVAVRVHDECNGSDVFGTDICTCRPYLMFALEGCVECAQRGGVGVLAYFRKEGRSLGEVTKFRVYNARKHQDGGDCPEKYFHHTESIAGVRDARFQVMMPDVLLWLGISRIDWLFSMSSEKYDAITERGIHVMQRVSLPDVFVPENAKVEITAKISAGYHTENVHNAGIVEELRELSMVRQKCGEVFTLAEANQLRHFNMDLSKLDGAANLVIKCIDDQYPDLKVPYHSRFRHFGANRVTKMKASWPCDETEKIRRLIDMVTVSVLLDAGAGATWSYHGPDGKMHGRSEGLAIASLDMFQDGLFSSDKALPCRVNSLGLQSLTLKELEKGFQVTEANPMVGLEGRGKLLRRLGKALEKHPEFFGYEVCRPGNIVDYVLKHVKDGRVSIRVVWKPIIEGLESIWPATIAGVRRGDVWSYNPLKKIGKICSDLIPFHKLSQWLLLSMLEPLEELGIKFDDMRLVTPLAEYRNGGLLVDTGLLTLKKASNAQRTFAIGSELVVEWRALTIVLIEKIAEAVRAHYGKTEDEMPLAMVLEGGTWRAGRQIAALRRADGSSPIKIRSDGTVF